MSSNSITPMSAFLPASSNDATPAASATDQLANKQIFMQLLVAQLKNQNPLSPADGTQFITQLAQFSQLEQATSMGQDIASILKILQTPTTPSTAKITNPSTPINP